MTQYLRNLIRIHKTSTLSKPFSLGLFKQRKTIKTGRSLNNQKGFTLVELLVAITLMVIGVFAVIGMQTVALQSNSIADQLTVATSLASGAIEDISSSTWSSTVTGITNGTDMLPFGSETTYGTYSFQNKGLYTITCIPTNLPNIAGMVKLDVIVTYSNKGIDKSVMMSGYKRVI